jgi:chromosome segregation ATPase
MRAAGFDGFERGERGSTAEHLSDLEYKTKRENERLADAAAAADEKQKEVAGLDSQAAQKQKKIAGLDKKLAIQKKAEGDIAALDDFGKNKNLVGQIVVTPEEVKNITRLAREGAASRTEIYDLKFALNRVNHELAAMTKDRDTWKTRYQGLLSKVGLFLNALKRAPKRVMEFLTSVMRDPPEQAEPERVRHISKTHAR